MLFNPAVFNIVCASHHFFFFFFCVPCVLYVTALILHTCLVCPTAARGMFSPANRKTSFLKPVFLCCSLSMPQTSSFFCCGFQVMTTIFPMGCEMFAYGLEGHVWAHIQGHEWFICFLFIIWHGCLYIRSQGKSLWSCLFLRLFSLVCSNFSVIFILSIRPFALLVMKIPSLTSLGLRSLREISDGSVYITQIKTCVIITPLTGPRLSPVTVIMTSRKTNPRSSVVS